MTVSIQFFHNYPKPKIYENIISIDKDEYLVILGVNKYDDILISVDDISSLWVES